MELHERIKYIRKEHLKMSRAEFGKKLGVSGDVINNIESNRLARPDQKLPLLKLICATFGVSESWLLNGEGEMFVNDDIIDRLARENGLNDDMKILLKKIMELPEDAQDIIGQFIKDTADEFEAAAQMKETDSVSAAEADYEKAFGIQYGQDAPTSNTTDATGTYGE